MKIVIIAGSPRKESITRRVAKHLSIEISKLDNVEVNTIDIAEIELPNLQGVWTSIDKVPTKLQPIAQLIFDADAYILVTPEFNGSYTPALKNLLDHFPKRQRKAFGLVTASPGMLGGMRAAQQLLLLVPGLFGIASPHLLVVPFVDQKFNENAELTDSQFAPAVKNFIDEFYWLSSSISKK